MLKENLPGLDKTARGRGTELALMLVLLSESSFSFFTGIHEDKKLHMVNIFRNWRINSTSN